MRNNRTMTRTLLVGLAALTLLALSAARAAADERLRWKFTPGEKLNYKTVQDMTASAEGGPVGTMETKVEQVMDMTWNIERVDEQGDAVIRQTFDRVTMKMSMQQRDPQGVVRPLGSMEYDSASEEAPVGLAAMLAPMYKALTENEFVVTMSERGEIKDVTIPEEVVAAMKNIPGAAQMGDFATADGFKKMIAQGAMVLPEGAPQPDEEWSTKLEMPSPVGGTQTVETNYTYKGTKEIDGTTYAVVQPEMKIEFAAVPGVDIKVADQRSNGEALFNVEEGRLHSSTLEQSMTVNMSAEGQMVKQAIDTKVEVTVTPVE